MRIPVNSIGIIGEIAEIPSVALPPGAWTSAHNIDFRDGIARKAKGYSVVVDGTDILARPQWLMPYTDPATSTLYWIYCGLNNDDEGLICTYDGANNVDRTDTANYPDNYAETTVWTGAVVNGLAVVNNQGNTPQMWDRTSGSLNADFEDLTNWDTNKTCRVLRGFRDFFIAMDITDSATTPQRNPYEIMHSGIVDPYTPPAWTPATTNRAGSKYIGEGGGFVVDGLALRDAFIIYTESEAHVMRFIGGNEVFSVDRIFTEYGILARRCVKPFKDGMHFLVSTGDIVIHDGTTVKSVCDGKVRDKIFGEIDTTNYINSFVVSHYNESEMWFCYPTSGSIYANRVAKWNVKTGAWSLMNFPDAIAHIGYGAVPTGENSGVWDDDTGYWDDDTSVWDEGNYNPAVRNLMVAHCGDTIAASDLFKGDDSNQFDGSNLTAILRRDDLTIIGNGSNGPVSDSSVYKYVDKIWPRIDGSDNVSIRVGGKDELGDTYVWDGPYVFNPSSDYKVDLRVGGRYVAVEFSSDADVAWGVTGYDLEVSTDGER